MEFALQDMFMLQKVMLTTNKVKKKSNRITDAG